MKKKFIIALLSVCFVLPCMFMLAACSKEPPEPTLEGVMIKLEDSLQDYYNEASKTFTSAYGDSNFCIDESSFMLVEKYSDGSEVTINNSKYVVDIPAELDLLPIPTSSNPYVITVTYGENIFTYYVNITSQQVSKPVNLTTDTFTYSGSSQTIIPVWFDSTKMEIFGNEQINAGTHEVEISLKSGYVWDDGSRDVLTFNWVINKAIVQAPTFTNNQTFKYDGAMKSPNLDGCYNDSYNTVVEAKTNVGNYQAYFELKNKTNYVWSTGNSDNIIINWVITKGQLAKPNLINKNLSLNYDLTTYLSLEQNILSNENVNNYALGSVCINVSGNIASNAGDYSVTFSLADKTKYEWTDGTNADIVVDWHITKATLQDSCLPVINQVEHVYKSEEISIVDFVSFNSYLFENPTGNLTATNVKTNGNYEISFALKDGHKQNFVFTSGNNNNIVKEWRIVPKVLNVPVLIDMQKEYNTLAQEFIPENANYSTFKIEDNIQTNVGEYKGKVYLSDNVNYKWSDLTLSSTDHVEFNYSIYAKSVIIPSVNGNLTYNGSEQSINEKLINFDSNIMNIKNNTSVDVVTNKEAIITLKDTTNYCWSNGTISEVIIKWTMNPMLVNASIKNENDYYYTSESLTAEIIGIDTFKDSLSVSNNTTQTEPGKYTIILTLTSNNYKWIDEDSSAKNLLWTIHKRLRAKPHASDIYANDYVYDGTQQDYWPKNFNEEFMNIEDNVKVDAGEYIAKVTLKDTTHDQWEDKTNEAVVFNWEIKSKVVTKPTASMEEFVYDDGNALIYIPENFDESYMNISGDVETEAGNYVCIVSLKNPNKTIKNYVWDDWSTDDLEFNWVIKAKEITINIESSHWLADFEEGSYDESTEYVLPYLSEDLLLGLPDIFDLTYEHYYEDGLCEEEPIVQGSGNYRTVAIFTLKEEYANNYILKFTYDYEEVEEIYLVWELY